MEPNGSSKGLLDVCLMARRSVQHSCCHPDFWSTLQHPCQDKVGRDMEKVNRRTGAQTLRRDPNCLTFTDCTKTGSTKTPELHSPANFLPDLHRTSEKSPMSTEWPFVIIGFLLSSAKQSICAPLSLC